MNRYTILTMITLTLSSPFAFAGPASDVPTMEVRFADIDLSRTEGAAALYQRLKMAAKTVCAPLERRELWSVARLNECVETAISTAVVKIDRPALTAYHQAHSKTGNAPIQVANK